MKKYTVTIVNTKKSADIRTVSVDAIKSMDAHKNVLLNHCHEDEHITLINDEGGDECYVSGMGFIKYV